MDKSRYSKLLTQYPLPIILVVLVVVVTCTLVNVFLGDPPDFSDPIKGFIPRNTPIHSSYTAWLNLLSNTSVGSGEPGKLLTISPASEASTEEITSHNYRSKRHGAAHYFSGLRYDGDVSSILRTARQVEAATEKFFCDRRPNEEYSKLVFAIENELSLLSLPTFTQLCHLQTKLELSSSYIPVCDSACSCNSFSLVNYAAYISSRNSCHYVTSSDLAKLSHLLQTCYPYYQQLHTDCWLNEPNFSMNRCNVSDECANQNLYQIYHYILPQDWMQTSEDSLKLTTAFIHMDKGHTAYDLYTDLKRIIQDTSNDDVKLYALDFGLKEYVFEEYLLKDSAWVGLALAGVLLVLWVYTESIFLTCMSLLSLAFTVIISYTMYQFVYRINYFPFLNLLAAVVVVGTGADDLFVYWKTWTALKNSRNASILERLVNYTIKHASGAMFVTSASTATAFFASAYTDIVAIRCFCLYAGTCVMVHYLLVVTWLPACVVLYEKYSLGICYTTDKSPMFCKLISRAHHKLTSTMTFILKKMAVVSSLWYIWLPLFSLLTVAGGLAVFCWPKLSAPSADMFQMLPANHPFEVYDMEVKDRFAFESYQESRPHLPAIFVFGVDSTFTGSYFDLDSTGTYTQRPLPDIYQPEVQAWFSNFCYHLRQQSFFDDSISQPSGCFIEEFMVWMRFRSCSSDPLCCSNKTFPYNATVMSTCLHRWSSLNKKPFPEAPGIRYSHNKPSSLVISFWTNTRLTYNYTHMEELYSNVMNFTTVMANKCPYGVCTEFLPMVTTSGGWLFFDVQQTLILSLPLSLAIVLGTSSLIIFLTTLNILLTICSLISISCSILSTLGLLSLLGWDLNILESVIVSLTVGLAMDYPLHVAVAYKIASATQDRKSRVLVSLHHVGGSIFAAMITTLIAGFAMLPTHIIAYQRLGLFLIIVTTSSWLSSFYFMPSLLLIMGPVGSFTQLHCRCRRRHRPARQLDKTIYSDEISSDVLTHTVQTFSSNVNTQDDSIDDSQSLELVTQTTRLLGPTCNSQTVLPPPVRLSTIREASISEQDQLHSDT